MHGRSPSSACAIAPIRPRLPIQPLPPGRLPSATARRPPAARAGRSGRRSALHPGPPPAATRLPRSPKAPTPAIGCCSPAACCPRRPPAAALHPGPPPDCPEPPRPRRPPVLASHVARWRSRSRTPRRLFDPREAPRLGPSFGRLLPSSSPLPSSIKGSSGGCASASGSKRKASDCEGASSSAAKNDNANQVVGLDSGSGTPT
ncbi:hypothetical protein GQ55_6G256300 [Panicum hallii var. hallii]|uniref:Uncharacterized protein n=1 Tax=Panicum hallii var. hallii TaxID=1504633 RepID=A0A2T7D9M6_9POAL|nr:hypothetical protein GQ55_6G256300 [Panicum hallii var. hallii]